MKKTNILATVAVCLIALMLFLPVLAASEVTEETETPEEKLIFHFINLGNSDAILLELEGKYALIDAGESDDRPDGSDPQYPARESIKTEGYQQKLIGYLNTLGVQNLEFLLLTNATSSHMDGASYVINNFTVDTVYMSEYSDNRIATDRKKFDNQYCYDKTLRAVNGRQPKTTLVQQFSTLPKSSNGHPLITFGNAEIELFNCESATEIVGDERLHSIVSLITYGGKKALFASSILNDKGMVDEIAKEVGSITLLKLQNHGLDDGTDVKNSFLTELRPLTTVNTGYFSTLSFAKLLALQQAGTTLYLTEESDQAVKLAFSADTSTKFVNCLSDPCVYYKAVSRTWCAVKDGKAVIDEFLDFFSAFQNVTYYFAEDGNSIYNGFFTKNDNTYYSNAYGIIQKGWINIGKEKYYFNSKGVMLKGIQKIGDNKYYFNESGIMQNGLQIVDNKCYYFDNSTGAMKTGLQKIAGKEYYFNPNGNMQTGSLVNIGGYTYYFDAMGQKKTKFQMVKDKTYYFDPNNNGRMVTGLQKINDSYYYFNKKGVLQTDWVKFKNGMRYFNEDGVMQTGWITIGTDKYYLDRNGYCKTYWFKYKKHYYYMGKNGAMRTGWQTIKHAKYYLGKEGIMRTGWQTIKDKVYSFTDKGKMRIGWKNIDGNWYYFNEKGERLTGWVAFEEKAYYLIPESNGAMAIGWKTIGNATYYFDETGERKTGWVTLGEDKYYLNASGELLKGVYYIDEKACYFDETGRLIKNHNFDI